MAMDDILRDLRFAWRALRRTPGFTLSTILSLGAGLALAATTIAVVNAYLLRSLPYPAADRLYHVLYAPIGQPEPRGLTALDWRALSDLVEVADSSAPTRFYIGDGGYTEEAAGLQAAAGSLEGLRVRAALGRGFEPADYAAAAEPVAMIGHALWRTRFGSDPQVVGRLLRASRGTQEEPSQTYRIVGVLPPEFRYVREYARGPLDIVVPLRSPLRVYMVRLREGVPADLAARRITEVAKAIGSAFPPGWRGVELEPVHERYAAAVRPVLTVVAAGVAVVLLIVCANVAVLTLLRATRRQQEIAVRVAIGAGRRHIVRMLVAEIAIVCAAAAGVAVVMTVLTRGALAPAIEAQLGRPAPGGTDTLDPTVALLMAAVTAAIALSLSFVSLVAPWSGRLADALRRDARGGTDRPGTRRLRSALIAFELATSLALLVGGGLMIRTVVNLLEADLGFDTRGVARSRLVIPARTYPDAAALVRFHDRLLEELSSVPGAQAALTAFPLLVDGTRQRVGPAAEGDAGGMAPVMPVSTGFFETLRIQVSEGRIFNASDRAEAEPVAIVSQALARRLWPGQRAIGQRLHLGGNRGGPSPGAGWRTVVGVARDVRQTRTDADLLDVYVPYAQVPSRFTPIYLRSDRPLAWSLETLRTAVGRIDSQVLVAPPGMLQAEADRQMAGTRFVMSILIGFAAFAALLAALGIYGVTAYAVRQRELEVAIRMALGATRRRVIGMFLKEGGAVVGAGIAAGLAGGAAIARLLGRQLHGVGPLDAWTLAVMSAVTVACAALATWWPARRAAGRNPAATLRSS